MQVRRPGGRWRRRAICLFALGLAAIAGKTLAASEPAAGKSEVLRRQREAVEAQIARLSESDDKDGKENGKGESPGRRDEKKKAVARNLLRSLAAVYAQHETRLQQQKKLEAETKEAEKELESLDNFKLAEPRPYSFLLLESLSDQLAVEEEREEATKADEKAARHLLQAAHDEIDAGAGTASQPPAKGAEASGVNTAESPQLDPAELARSLARAEIGLRQTGVEVQGLRLGLCKIRQKQLAGEIKLVKQEVSFSAADRDKQLGRVAAAAIDLKRRRREVETSFEQLDSERKAALKELTERQAAPQTVDAAVDAWRTASEVYQSELVLLDQRLDLLEGVRRAWKRRYDLANSTVETKKLSQWLGELDEFVAELKDMQRSLEHRRDTARAEQSVVAGTAGDGQLEETGRWHRFQEARLQQLRDLCETSLDYVKSMQRAMGRFRADLKAKIDSAPGDWSTTLGGVAHAILAYQVAQVGEQSITVSKLLVLLAYIVGGTLLAYAVSRLIGRRILPQLGLHHGTASALNSIVFYVLCVLFGVLSFQMLHIPLAAFAFLGGAAAIAVGFGSQDIMNNFMSGIILLVEQPIRVGDVVQISDVQGVVLHIGLRSTRLQTEDNHEVIVPNKTLLDEQVINLTLSDNFVQTFVTITLDRSVPIVETKWKMLEVAFLHPMVIKSPRPVVLLKEADTYWLTFEIHFWLQHRSFMKCAVVRSEILEIVSAMFMPEEEDKTKDEKQPVEGESIQETIQAADPSVNGEAVAENGKAAAAGAAARTDEGSILSALTKLSSAAMKKQVKRVSGAVKLKV